MKEMLTPLDIERIALEAGKTMGTVCQEAGVAHSTFSRWKKGKSSITVGTIAKLLDALKREERAAE